MQLASLEKRCIEKSGEIADLEHRIQDKLEEEEAEKQAKLDEHLRDTKSKKDKNAAMRK